MHILLTDILVCPRCGPGFGLILLAERVVDRRVEAGVLGCSGCEARYAIRGGVGRFGELEGEVVVAPATREPGGLELAAWLGAGEGTGLLVVGASVETARELAGLVAGIEVVVLAGGSGSRAEEDAGGGQAGSGGVSVLEVGDRLPLTSGRTKGVALTGAAVERWLEEGARLLSPAGRLVLAPPPTEAVTRLSALGLRLLAGDERACIAVRS